MAVSSYFNHLSNTPEQNLIEDNVIESIKMMGMDIKYIPREDVNVDYLFREDLSSQFGTAITIEMYLRSFDTFGGNGDMFSGMGLEINDTLNMDVSKKRFEEEFAGIPLIRPREGDLIFFPLNKALFEIKFVEDESVFYQTGKRFVYELRCALFEYNDEEFTTGDAEIDQIVVDMDTTTTLANDPFAQNTEIEAEADGVATFDPDNPFGTE